MQLVRILLLISVAIVGMLALPGFSGQPSSVNPVMVSYNPSSGNRFHSPLSSMGLSGVIGAQPGTQGLNLTSSSSSVNIFGPQTIRQNSLRFISDTSTFPQSETTLAIDPNNSSRIVGGFNDARFFFCRFLPVECAGPPTASLSGFTTSTDGGKTVAKTGLIPDLNVNGTFLVSWGDPSITPSTDGNFFYASLAIDPFNILLGDGMMIAKSNSNLFNPNVPCITDPGNPFSNPCWNVTFIFGNFQFPVFTVEDKDRISVDRDLASPFFGSVYVSWDHFNAAGTSVSYLARCDPNILSCPMLSGGQQPILSSSDQFVAWTTVVVDKSGNVDVAWCNFGTFITFGPVSCRIRSSTPGGTGFGSISNIITYMGDSTMLPGATVVIGWATEQFRTSAGLISIAADMSPNSSNLYFTTEICVSGHYYRFSSIIAPVAADNPGLCGRSAVLFSESIDGGATWSSPLAISKLAVNDQPYVTVDSLTGQVYVVHYTTQYDKFDHLIDVVVASSSNGGMNFHQFRVTSVSNEPDSDPNMFNYIGGGGTGGSFIAPQYGDYFEAVAKGGTLRVILTENFAVEAGTFQTDPFLATMTLNG